MSIEPPALSGRRLRFRIWALMATVVLLGLPLGLTIEGVRRERRAIEAIRRLGGAVFYDDQQTPSGRWDSSQGPRRVPLVGRWLPEELLREPTFVSLRNTGASDEDLRAIACLRRVEYLDLEGTAVGDEGIRHIAGMAGLKYLYLHGADLSDAALRPIGRMPGLRQLFLNDTRVDDDGIDQLGSLKDLQTIGLKGTGVTAAGIERLGRSRPGLEILSDANSPPPAPSTDHRDAP